MSELLLRKVFGFRVSLRQSEVERQRREIRQKLLMDEQKTFFVERLECLFEHDKCSRHIVEGIITHMEECPPDLTASFATSTITFLDQHYHYFDDCGDLPGMSGLVMRLFVALGDEEIPLLARQNFVVPLVQHLIEE